MGIGTHTSHCCKQHGCKYGNADCPVEFYGYAQEYPCEFCHEDISNFYAQNVLKDYYILVQVMQEFIKQKFGRKNPILGIRATNHNDSCFVLVDGEAKGWETVDLEEFNTFYREHRFKGLINDSKG